MCLTPGLSPVSMMRVGFPSMKDPCALSIDINNRPTTQQDSKSSFTVGRSGAPQLSCLIERLVRGEVMRQRPAAKQSTAALVMICVLASSKQDHDCTSRLTLDKIVLIHERTARFCVAMFDAVLCPLSSGRGELNCTGGRCNPVLPALLIPPAPQLKEFTAECLGHRLCLGCVTVSYHQLRHHGRAIHVFSVPD